MAPDNSSDILIIGGGVIGLAIARELRKRGAGTISILDKGEPGREASWAAAGILAPQAEADRADDLFELCSASNRMYPQLALELLDETGIDIELDTTGTLYIALTDEDSCGLEDRFEWQRAAGLNVQRLTAVEARKLEPAISPEVKFGLLFPDDHQVENRKLLAALIKYAEVNAIDIRRSVEVKKILIRSGAVTGVETSGETIPAEKVVIATGAWSSLITVGDVDVRLPVRPIRGQMISYDAGRPCRHVIYSRRGYLVPRAGGRLLAGATAEDAGFDKIVSRATTGDLAAMAETILPELSRLVPAESWVGLRPFAADGLPVIGAFSTIEGLFAATGHFRNGILLAPLTGRLVADAIEGKRDSRHRVFGPDRFAK